MTSTYWVYWIVLLSMPMIAWLAFYALVTIRSRRGDIEVRVNSFAISGAFLALVSLATGWSAVESGYDWSATTQMSFFLLLTYPVALITPLAGVGQATVLVWVLAWVLERDASIGMWPGYLVAWVSTAFMFAGLARPASASRMRATPALSDRLLTITIRRSSGQWMPGNQALACVISAVVSVVAACSIVFGRGLDAALLLLVCLAFVLYLLRVNPLAGLLSRGVPRIVPSPSGTGRRSHLAWVLFLGASFLAAVIALDIATSSFGSSGLSGEERTSVLVWGSPLLAVAIAVAMMAHRRAVEPSLPKNLMTATVVLFSLLTVMSAVATFTSWLLILSATEFLILAGLVLVGIPVVFIQGQAAKGAVTN